MNNEINTTIPFFSNENVEILYYSFLSKPLAIAEITYYM